MTTTTHPNFDCEQHLRIGAPSSQLGVLGLPVQEARTQRISAKCWYGSEIGASNLRDTSHEESRAANPTGVASLSLDVAVASVQNVHASNFGMV